MSEHIEKQQLHELLKELAQKEYGDKYGEKIFWYFQDVIDDSCRLDVLEEENDIAKEKIKSAIEEIERLKQVEKEHQRINGELREELKELEEIQRIGREREYHSKFLKDFQKERGKNVFPDHDEIYKRYDDYKLRVDRAVEYIKDELWEIGGHVNGSDLLYDKAIQPLLDILKGEDRK